MKPAMQEIAQVQWDCEEFRGQKLSDNTRCTYLSTGVRFM
jgi:hypothetical protein